MKDDKLELSDGQIEEMGKLEESKLLAQKFFGTGDPTPEMIFGIYDRIFDCFDDDLEDDED
jgi:hypothetical protein